jgi:hypothetical protein
MAIFRDLYFPRGLGKTAANGTRASHPAWPTDNIAAQGIHLLCEQQCNHGGRRG